MYRSEVKKLLLIGAIGFASGIIIGVAAFRSDGATIPEYIFFGWLFACLIYGWFFTGRIMNQYFVIGSIPIMIIAFLLRFMCAYFVGLVAYPIALIKCFIQMKREEHNSKL